MRCQTNKPQHKMAEAENQLVAYKIDARCARETLTAGTMVCSEKVVCYVV